MSQAKRDARAAMKRDVVDKVHTVMKEFKNGQLHSGSKTGPLVTSRDQAEAIALSEQKKANK